MTNLTSIEQDYSFDTIYLDTDPGGHGYRTADWETAKDYAIREAQRTHRRQVIQVFPSSERPSGNIHRVFEVDIEHVSNVLETDVPRFIDPAFNGL